MKQLTLKDRQHMWALEWQQSRDERAMRRLVDSCMGLVYREAGKARRWSGLERDDLNAEGVFGIVRAAEKYDPERGQFAACAAVWIRYNIQLYARQNWSQLRVSHGDREYRLHQRIAGTVERHESAGMSRTAAIAAAARDLGVEVSHAEQALMLKAPGRQISGTYDDDDHGVDPADDAPPVEDVLDRGRVAGILADCMSGLDDRERTILAARFTDDGWRSLEDLGAEFSISKERIRQIEREALKYLRIELKSRGLNLEDLL